jgi:hypothetical protein
MDGLIKFVLVIVAVVVAIAMVVGLTVVVGLVITLIVDESLRPFIPVSPVLAWALLGLTVGVACGLLRAGRVERVPSAKAAGILILTLVAVGLVAGVRSAYETMVGPRREITKPTPTPIPARVVPRPAPTPTPVRVVASPPPLPYIEKEAHPFEGAVYRDWVARAAMTMYAQPSQAAAWLGRVEPGTRMRATTGETHTQRYGELVVTRDHALRVALPGRPGFGDLATHGAGGAVVLNLRRGDRLYLAACYGEGACRYWFGDRFYDFGIDLADTSQWSRQEMTPAIDWWCHVVTESGVSGWLRNPEVDGADQFGDAGSAGADPPETPIRAPTLPAEPAPAATPIIAEQGAIARDIEPQPTPLPPAPVALPDLEEPAPAAPARTPAPKTFKVSHRHSLGIIPPTRGHVTRFVRPYCEGLLSISSEGVSFVTLKSPDRRFHVLDVSHPQIRKAQMKEGGRLHFDTARGKWDFELRESDVATVWQLLNDATRGTGAGGLSARPTAASSAVATIPHQSQIFVRLERPLSTRKARQGDRFVVRLTTDLVSRGEVIAPAGSRASGFVREVAENVRAGGEGSWMVLRLERIETLSGEQQVFAELRIPIRARQSRLPTNMTFAFLLLTRPG